MGERKSSEATIKRNIAYNAKHVKQFKMNLNKNTDADIIEHLETKENKQGYVKELIRKDMK